MSGELWSSLSRFFHRRDAEHEEVHREALRSQKLPLSKRKEVLSQLCGVLCGSYEVIAP